jgi:S1-C subfamily serine protease
MFQQLANATVRIACGDSRGSGFHFIQPQIVVTNHHVLEKAPRAAVAGTEDGEKFNLTCLAYSPRDEFDYAVCLIEGDVPGGRVVLQPAAEAGSRGQNVLFSGFPHGLEELLVQRAVISGPAARGKAFYIDGAVNGGNSGGPIVDATTGALLGITTRSRFLYGGDLEQMAKDATELAAFVRGQQTAGGGIGIGGIDWYGLLGRIAETNTLVSRLIEANANTGLGVGFHIGPVVAECRRLAL